MAVTTSPIATQKSALVVDDSKLARYVLKEMLVDLGINVETAESAEEALGALSAFKPDVIFMDHMMPGMDGLQAVQAIKSDPKTATIPILMYTSKDEGVYVNQARALGAVGVLPKKLKPVQLEKVLVQLKLVPPKEPIQEKSTHEAVPSTADVPSESKTTVHSVHSIKDTQETRKAGSQNTLEELARSASEEQEKDSMRLLFRQLFSEQRDSIKQDQWQLVAAMVDQVTPIVLAARNKMASWQIIALSGMFVFLMCILGLLYSLMSASDFQQQVLQQQITQQKEVLQRLETSMESAQINQGYLAENLARELNVKPLEWAINHNSQLSFYQPLNSISTQTYMTQLINQLDDFEFRGSIYIQFHSGRFCQKVQEGGQHILVSPEKSVSQCQFNLQGVNNLAALVEFENFLASLNQQFPNIKVLFEPVGTQFMLQDYPDISEDITAGEWNAIAKRNNRFDFVLVNEE